MHIDLIGNWQLSLLVQFNGLTLLSYVGALPAVNQQDRRVKSVGEN